MIFGIFQIAILLFWFIFTALITSCIRLKECFEKHKDKICKAQVNTAVFSH